MDRTFPYDKTEKCDTCGEQGAFDMMGDFICEDCLTKESKVMDIKQTLFDKYAIKYTTHNNPNDFIETTSFLAVEKFFFEKALTEYKSQIIGIIEKFIDRDNLILEDEEADHISAEDARIRIAVLTELKGKIEAL